VFFFFVFDLFYVKICNVSKKYTVTNIFEH